MIIHSLILLFKILIWVAVAVRNVKKKYFTFFLVLAAIDPFYLLMKEFVSFTNNILYVPLNIILYSALKPSLRSVVILTSLVLILFSVEFSPVTINLSIILAHFFVAVYFLNNAIADINTTRQINLFYPLLFLFAVITIVKAWLYTFDTVSGLSYFFIFNGLQLLIGIHMLIFTQEKCPAIPMRMLLK